MCRRILFVIPVLLCLLAFSSQAVELGKDPDPLKMAAAKNKFNDGDYNGALRIYRDLYQEYKDNATLNFRMGECYLQLQESDEAIKYFEDARKIDASVDVLLGYYMGIAYRQKSMEPKAVEWLEEFVAQPKMKKDDREDGQQLLDHCKNTIEFMAKPVNVKITSASANINTGNHEYHPSITADGKIMVFTSRREDTNGGGKDKFDEDYYEDVYITYWDEEANDWSPAKPIVGGVNGKEHDACLSISPDGRRLFMYRNTNAGDIYVAKNRPSKEAREAVKEGSPDQYRMLTESKWSTPQDLGKPVNSGYWDSYACVNADGNRLFFSSERPGNKTFGNGDLYMAKSKTRSEWNKPVNLGPVINSIEDEKGVFIHPDGKTLFFASKGHKSMGGYDIFKSTMNKKGVWSEPENLGYPINTPRDEFDFVVSTDGQTAYYCAQSDTSEKFDILKVDLSNYNVMAEGPLSEQSNGLSLLKGRITNNQDQPLSVNVTLIDPNGAAIVKSAESDEDGNYFLAVEGGKDYELVINAKGYQEYRNKVTLAVDENGVVSQNLDVILVAK